MAEDGTLCALRPGGLIRVLSNKERKMRKIMLAAVVILSVSAGTVAAGDRGHGGYHLNHRHYQGYFDHRHAYGYPVTGWQYERRHDFRRAYPPYWDPYSYRYYQGPSGLTLSGPRYHFFGR